MLTQSEDKEDHASVVQLDQGGVVSDLLELEVEKVYEKRAMRVQKLRSR